MSISRRNYLATLASGLAGGMLAGCGSSTGPEESTRQSLPPLLYRRLPPLAVEGWINGGPLTEEQMQGRVVVLDCFATWCGPCVEAAPELVQTYLKYRYNGVRFIGLTSEPAADLDQVQAFSERLNMEWPIAYGAGPTMQFLEVNAVPWIFVIGRDGIIRWDSQRNEESLERAIRDALAEPEPSEPPPESTSSPAQT